MPIALTDSNFDKILNFETYLGERLRGFKFVSLLDAGTVVQLGFDAPAKHHQYYGSLPPGAPTSYTGYKYAKFLDNQNVAHYFGTPWIVPASVVESEDVGYVIRIKKVDQSQLQSLRSMLVANGIEDFTIEPM